MKFEKINKDKIKITLDSDDLSANDIDFNSFMSNSEETHALFLDVLEKAEKDYDFSTKDYRLKVETVALSDGNFIMTITRESDKPVSSYQKKPIVTRKSPNLTTSSIIYRFNSFDDFCCFVASLSINIKNSYLKIAKNSILYSYNGYYYLIFANVNVKIPQTLKIAFSLVTEFGVYVDYSEVFVAKLHENGKVIFKSKAIQNCIKYFME